MILRNSSELRGQRGTERRVQRARFNLDFSLCLCVPGAERGATIVPETEKRGERTTTRQAHLRSFSAPLYLRSKDVFIVMAVQQNDIIKTIKDRLGAVAQSVAEMKNDDIMVVVEKDSLIPAVQALKTGEGLRFTTLMNHLGADYRDYLAAIYNLYSPMLRRKVTVKALLDREHPEVHSLEPLFRGINWYERETYDMLGIRFTGHSNLKRLLLPEDWSGFPLRKDYVYPESYNGIETGRADLLDNPLGAGDCHV